MGVPRNIMRALCAEIRPDHFKFASYGPVEQLKICILPGLPSFYLKIWLSKVKCYIPFSLKRWLKRNYRKEFLKCTFLPAELERGTEVLQFDVCCKAVDQNFNCGCDHCAILRLDSLPIYCYIDKTLAAYYYNSCIELTVLHSITRSIIWITFLFIPYKLIQICFPEIHSFSG